MVGGVGGQKRRLRSLAEGGREKGGSGESVFFGEWDKTRERGGLSQIGVESRAGAHSQFFRVAVIVHGNSLDCLLING